MDPICSRDIILLSGMKEKITVSEVVEDRTTTEVAPIEAEVQEVEEEVVVGDEKESVHQKTETPNPNIKL